jgi:hypothetical protein
MAAVVILCRVCRTPHITLECVLKHKPFIEVDKETTVEAGSLVYRAVSHPDDGKRAWWRNR